MKIISFSLWGSSKLYCLGALENIPLVHQYYPGWIPRFYVAENCPALQELEEESTLGNCQVIIKPPTNFVWGSTVNVEKHHDPSHINMVNRYEAVFDPLVDVCLFRDCDSRVSARDADSVNDWLERKYVAHCIYECDAHHANGGVMPGMSGLHTFPYQGNVAMYNKAFKKFTHWYSTDGYRKGFRFVHLDIHWFNWAFLQSLDKDEIMKCGHNTPNPLKVPGDPVGSTINEEWRYLEY